MKHETTYITDFIQEIYIRCPQCEHKALVRSDGMHAFAAKLTCTSCGLNKKWVAESRSNPKKFYTPHAVEHESIVLGAPVDCFFRQPLWYRTDCCGEELYAYNPEHLTFLRTFIGDKLRERQQGDTGWSNGSLQSRLPVWMLSSKNRDAVLNSIDQLLRT
jgi:hypothetical protein